MGKVESIAADVDTGTLVPIVRDALESPQAQLLDWGCERMSAISGFGEYRGLFRFRGSASVQGRVLPWSLVLKVVRRPPRASDDPGEPRYWRREADAYASDLLRGMAGIRPARCFGTLVPDAETFALWLEDVHDETGGRWPLARCGLAAEHLGEMSGTHAERGAPQPGWLLRRPLGGPTGAGAARMEALLSDDATWSHREVRRALPSSLRDAARAQWQASEALRAALVRVPSVLCHNDAHAQNLFSARRPDGSRETIAVDWELLGMAPLATDLTYLVIASMRRFVVDAADAEALESAVLDGYTRGLERAGHRAEPGQVRWAFTLSVGLRLGLVPQILAMVLNPQHRAREAQAWGRPADELVACWFEVARYVLDRARRARERLAAG